MQEEMFRSCLVEQYCPHVGKKVLGFVTYRLVPRECPDDGSQVRLLREVVRAKCLHIDSCEDLGCQRGVNPIAG